MIWWVVISGISGNISTIFITLKFRYHYKKIKGIPTLYSCEKQTFYPSRNQTIFFDYCLMLYHLNGSLTIGSFDCYPDTRFPVCCNLFSYFLFYCNLLTTYNWLMSLYFTWCVGRVSHLNCFLTRMFSSFSFSKHKLSAPRSRKNPF